MKKCFLLFVAALFVSVAIASPVSVNEARELGFKFAKNNLATAKQITEITPSYSMTLSNGAAGLYVFNYSHGFVVVAADDVAKPILGYSEECSFDAENIPEGLVYYLNHYKNQIEYAVENNIPAESEIAAEWDCLRKNGTINSKSEVRGVDPLINLLWNQDYPYNYYCPTHNYGPGGHVYVGCVADAMAMVMKYWNYPEQGRGSHSYTPSGFPTQTVNFEEAHYDWDNMPISISSGSQMAYIQAIALLMYHCGVSVDMAYGYDGSGSSSYYVPDAVIDYFRYAQSTNLKARDSYSKTEWEDMLMANLDEGFPTYYSGAQSNEGHAFVCDGYNANRYFHFNWGWSGASNGFYAIDALNVSGYHFNDSQTAIFDMIPDYVYAGLPATPSAFTVTPDHSNALTSTVAWTNPSKTLSGANLESISQIVVLRNGVVVHTENNPTPGAAMTFVDQVPDFDFYTYEIYAVTTFGKGRRISTTAQYGPACSWRILGSTTNFQGWNGGALVVKNSKNTIIEEFTLTSSGNSSEYIDIPEGNVTFSWSAPSAAVSSVTIIVKDENNATVYTYNGSSTGLTGTLYTENNQCEGCQAPENLAGEYSWEGDRFGVQLSWTAGEGETQKYYIYRGTDGVNYEKIGEAEGTALSYFDEVETGTYYYQVTAKHSGCESQPALNSSMDHDYVMVAVTAVDENSSIVTNVFPNPADGSICIQAEGMTNVVITNALGQVVYSKKLNDDGLVVNTSNFSAGIYMVNISTATGTTSSRFSVIH